MNRKEGIIMGIVVLATFITGVFAVPEQQLLNVFVTNLPAATDQIVLNCAQTQASFDLQCRRGFPDGTTEFTFTVPVGKVLVVTDVTWSISYPTGTVQSPGGSFLFEIRLRNPIPDAGDPNVFLSSGILGQNSVSGSEHLATGFVVSAGTVMYTILIAGSHGAIVTMHGYLVTP